MSHASDDWAGWREHFPDLKQAIYLDTASHGARSTRVTNAFATYLADWTVDPAWDGAWRAAVAGAERRFARLVNAHEEDVVLMPTVTHAFHAIMSSWSEPKRPKVVLAEDEWVSSRHAVAAWPGVEASVVPATSDDDALLSAIDERTRWVVASHVGFQTGRRRDLRRLADAAHEQGARLFVDAFQSAGVVPLDFETSRADALSAGSLKYLLGVPGAAFLAVRPAASGGLVPRLVGWRGQRDPMDPTLQPAGDAQRFATGTWLVPNAYAASAGMDLLFEAGLERVHRRVARLVATFTGELDALGVPHATPRKPARASAIVIVPVPDPTATRHALRELGVIATARAGTVRFSFHAYVTECEARDAARRLATLLRERTVQHA